MKTSQNYECEWWLKLFSADLWSGLASLTYLISIDSNSDKATA